MLEMARGSQPAHEKGTRKNNEASAFCDPPVVLNPPIAPHLVEISIPPHDNAHNAVTLAHLCIQCVEREVYMRGV